MCSYLIRALSVSQELVDDLYSFRDRYFETHSVEDAGRKQNDVAQEMAKTLERLEEKEGGHYFFLFYNFSCKEVLMFIKMSSDSSPKNENPVINYSKSFLPLH